MINDKAIPPEKALLRAEVLCARQERCSYDIRTKLKQWKVSPKDTEKIIKKLQDDGFINDERYARIFVRDKSKFNKWGPLKIAYALKSKYIEEGIIKTIMIEIVPTDDESILRDILSRKMKSIKAKSTYDLKAKLIKFGISRGFNFESVSKIVSLIANEHND